MNANTRTKAALLASFYAATRLSNSRDAMPMTAASAAGLLLHLGETTGGALRVCARFPAEGVWLRAAEYLRQLRETEGADTQPPDRLIADGDGR